MANEMTTTNPDALPELPEYAASLHVQLFRNAPSMRNTDFVEVAEFPQGAHRLYTADQMRAYARAALGTRAYRPLDEWERISMELLADGLRKRGDDLSTDSASWLEKWLSESTETVEAALAAPRQEGGDESDEDAHVIMMLGRLLAEIAIILKGPEPAGTAWSYHDLPEMVRAVTQESKDVADEMQAWANVKMTERGSSRRDKLMVAEWSKRLSGAATVTFPVKDFDVSGTTLTKQEMRAAVRRVMQSRVFAGQDFGRGDSINVLYVHPAEQREPHPDALQDGTLSKSTAKRVEALAAASVSERATVSLDLNNLPTEWPWDEGSPCLKPRPVGMVYPGVPTPRAFGYLDKTGVEWAAYDTGQMEEYGRRAFADGANTVLRAIVKALAQSAGGKE